MVSILLLLLAIAGFSIFSFGNIAQSVSAMFPKLSGGQVRWIALTIGGLAVCCLSGFIVAFIACGVAIFLKARR